MSLCMELFAISAASVSVVDHSGIVARADNASFTISVSHNDKIGITATGFTGQEIDAGDGKPFKCCHEHGKGPVLHAGQLIQDKMAGSSESASSGDLIFS